MVKRKTKGYLVLIYDSYLNRFVNMTIWSHSPWEMDTSYCPQHVYTVVDEVSCGTFQQCIYTLAYHLSKNHYRHSQYLHLFDYKDYLQRYQADPEAYQRDMQRNE